MTWQVCRPVELERDGLIDEQLEKDLIGSVGGAGGCEQGEQEVI